MRGANRQIKTMGAGAIVGSVLLFRQEELSDPTSVPAQGGYWVHTAITLPIMSTELNCTELYSLNHTTPPHKDYHHIPSSPIVCIDWQQQAANDKYHNYRIQAEIKKEKNSETDVVCLWLGGYE